MTTEELGHLGETRAAEYLQDHGHTIITRNWRTAHLEIDIISLGEDGMHFVEVKSRKAPLAADPLSNITPAKMRNVAAAAKRFLCTPECRRVLGQTCAEVHLDVITVVFDNDTIDIHYYPRAYTPIYA